MGGHITSLVYIRREIVSKKNVSSTCPLSRFTVLMAKKYLSLVVRTEHLSPAGKVIKKQALIRAMVIW